MKQNTGAYTFQPLHDLAHWLRRSIRYEHVDMVTCHFTRNYFDLMLQCNLPQQIPSPCGNCSREHLFSVFWNPYEVDFQVRLRMRAKFVKSHGDNINFSSPEGEGFPPSPKGTLTGVSHFRIKGPQHPAQFITTRFQPTTFIPLEIPQSLGKMN